MQIRNLKYFAILSLGIALTAYAAACKNPRNLVTQKSIALADFLEANRESAEPSDTTTIANPPACTSFQPSPSNEDALMFIDITQSMAGFTAGTTYREFDEVMDAVSSALGLSRVVLFGKSGALFQESAASFVLHDEAVYTGENNPDYCLWDFALNWDGDKPIVYLTDGVQSAESIGAPGPSVDALKQWLEKGHHVGIMAFRGEFSGRLWSEQARNWIGDFPEDLETGRPFYLFVLASDEAELRAVFGQLDTILRQNGAALKPEYGTSLTTVQFGERERTCNLNSTIPFWDNAPGSRWTWVDDPDVDSLKIGQATEIASWACEGLENAPSDPSVNGSVEFTYREWDSAAEAFGDPGDNPPEAKFNVANAKLTGTIGNGPPPPEPGYTFWALEISGERGPMRQELSDLSTFSDATLDAADKTYRFDSLIENLAAADFERQRPTAPFYMTLKH